MRIFISILFLSTALFGLSQNTNYIYDDLDKAIQKGKSKKAEKILLQISQNTSSTFLDLLKVSQYYNDLGKLDSSAKYIRLAIDYHKLNPMNYADPDFKAKKDSFYRQSIIVYDKIIDQNPLSPNYCARGVLKLELGLLQVALLDFNNSIKLDSNNFIAYYNRGSTYDEMGYLDSSILDYSKCIALRPDYGSAYLNKGYVLSKNEQYQQAIKEFQTALLYIKSPIETSYTLNNIGFSYYKLENFDNAIKFIEHSIELYPKNSYAYRNLALVKLAQGKEKEACKNAQKSIELGFIHQFGNEIIEIVKSCCD